MTPDDRVSSLACHALDFMRITCWSPAAERISTDRSTAHAEVAAPEALGAFAAELARLRRSLRLDLPPG